MGEAILLEKGKIAENVQKLSVYIDSDKMLKKAFGLIKIKKENAKRKIAFLMIMSIIAFMMAISEKTAVQTEETLEMLNTVMLSLFGIVFTGYALFQAMIGDELLILLVELDPADKEETSSKLEETNVYFIKVMMLQFFIILTNLLLRISLKLLPPDWNLFGSQIINEGICFIGVLAILDVNVEIIWEIKCFIFNVFQLYNLHAVSRILNMLRKSE